MPVSEFIRRERERAAAWKRSAADLLDEARAPSDYHAETGKVVSGPFAFCLPPAHAAGNLLPDARATALQTFKRLGIAWHAGIGDGPGNHLLDSQVQCANALVPQIRQPHALQLLLAEAFPIAEMLPIERDEFVTFEWIGLSDHLD
jgi:restriction endonuclease-like protein